MGKQLIVAVTHHRKFGVTLVPYVITPSNGDSLYSVIDKATTINIAEVDGYCDDFSTLLKLSATIDDMYIARLFSKEPPRDFLRHVDAQFVEAHVRPHMEYRLKKMLAIIVNNHIRLFYKDFKYNQIYLADEIAVAQEKSRVLFLFDRNENGIRYRIAIDHGDYYDKLKGKTSIVITDSKPCNVVINRTLYRFDDIDSKKFEPFLKNDFIHIRKETELVYFEKFIRNAIKNFKVKATGFEVKIENVPPKPILDFEYDIQNQAVLILKFAYADNVIFPYSTERAFVDFYHNADDVRFVKMFRQKDAELQIVAKLKDLGFGSSDGVNFYAIPEKPLSPEEQFYFSIEKVNDCTDELSAAGFVVNQRFSEHNYYIGKISLNLTAKLENDWFDIYGVVTLNGFTIPFMQLKRNILKQIREYELPNGTIVILPKEWFSRFNKIFHQSTESVEKLKVNKQLFELINESGIASPEAMAIHNLFDVNNLPKETLPSGLNATLRPYQLAGYYWMKQLKRNNFGGCLADDMGLGKTLQTLTLLLDSQQNSGVVEPIKPQNIQLSLFDEPQVQSVSKCCTSLIIMPLSLIHNWQNEARKFAPSLRVLPHVGINRTRNPLIFSRFDIVITTYGTLRNDVDILKNFQFNYIILDESQAIKNPTSKNYQSAIQLQSKYKLMLTGTPIENSLVDLWAQMNFANPGLLGDLQYFKDEYVQRIERDAYGGGAKQLQKLIEPFVLRRTKKQVAKELPPKTEQIRYCEMEQDQQILYETKKSEVRNEILANINNKRSLTVSALILKSLTLLRQIACHPKMLDFEQSSTKFDEVIRVLETIISENHKVLIFSSFVKYLELYKQYFDGHNIGYEMLTGDTKDRNAVVANFQNNNNIKVFLISLKAGGVGLNLTAADYVFILDPWWNPATENQAIDRAYRIGQDRNVFVYKFVTIGTIEEKIINLQNRKSDLASIVADNNTLKDLSNEQILELFE